MNIRVAIAEDNFFLTKVIEEKLSFFNDLKLKFTAVNGQELLDKLKKDPVVDLILMDLEMPVVDGIDATAEVRKRYPQIKIVMLTVFDNDENIFNCIKAGADGYLLKETEPQTLYKGILETLNGGAAMTPSIARCTIISGQPPT